MVTLEFYKDKFGESVTVTDISGVHTFAERNSQERQMFDKYKNYMAGQDQIVISWLDEVNF